MGTRMRGEDLQAVKTRLYQVLTQHVGRSKRIGMGELFEKVFREGWKNRINDTRRLRKLITELRDDGVPVCSSVARGRHGYWIASAGSELSDYCQNIRKKALGLLAQEARLRKKSMSELLGQLSLDLAKRD